LFEMKLVSLEELHWKWQILYICTLYRLCTETDWPNDLCEPNRNQSTLRNTNLQL